MSRHHRKKKISGQEVVELIKKNLGYKSLVKPPLHWLDLLSSWANKVFGSKKLGVPYGKVVLIAGPPSSGKSAIAAWILGLAQKDDADGAWLDGENSYDPIHIARQGVDPELVALFEPEYGEFKHKKQKKNKLVPYDVEAAEDVFNRAEMWMKLMHKQDPKGKRVLVVDSTTSFSPEEELMAGLTEQNMRTRTSPAVFLNAVSKRWMALAARTNTLIILIAQLRTNPGKMFGNPEYVTGGNGIQYYSSVVVWMRRIADGAIIRKGKQVGVKGIISNRKNKAGGGSIERKKTGYMAYFYEPKWNFVDPETIKKKEK
jgi:RecA/RadA recombinase